MSFSWYDLSLADGYPGLLILFATLERRGLLEKNDGSIAHQYVLKIKEALETQDFPGISLFSGITGVCFAIQYASLEGRRYQRMLMQLHETLLRHIKTDYLQPLQENIRSNSHSSSLLFDTMQGVAGIGRYILENVQSQEFADTTALITETLIALSKPLVIDENTVPGWYLLRNDPVNIPDPDCCSRGNFNLGLAHGIPGVLAFLAIALLKGISVEGQKDAIQRISYWLMERSFIDSQAIRWDYNVSWDEEVLHKKKSLYPCKDAWCYGVPGIAGALLIAGKAIGDHKLQTFAKRAFLDIFIRSQKEWNLPGPALCHGIAGLLLTTYEMSKENGCEILIPKVVELEQILLSFYNENFHFGFKDLEFCRNGKLFQANHPGLLNGSTGILLTLLTLSDPSLKWHTPLMIYG
ncbi:MAG: lanthionine synthetase C family protein [Rhabdochlamydiaceae bacterium]